MVKHIVMKQRLEKFKKFIMEFGLIAILGYIITLYFPWWSVVAVTFVVGFATNNTVLLSFSAGFAAMSGLWGGYANSLDSYNQLQLSGQLTELFMLQSNTQLLYATTLIGGVLGGMGAITGTLARQVITPKEIVRRIRR